MRNRLLSSGRSWMLVTLVVWLTACASAPDLSPEATRSEMLANVTAWQAAPPEQTTELTPLELVQWWQVFNDDALSALIEQALAKHSSVRSAQVALTQARAQRDATAAATLPSLRASGSAGRSVTGDASSGSAFRGGLDASWELDLWGARRSALAASEAELQASAAQLGQVRVVLAAEVALTYLEWLAQQHRLQVARQNLALQEAALQLTQWRVQAGLASQLDLYQALTLVGQTRASVAPLEASVQQSHNALAVLAGLTPQADLELPAMGQVPEVAVNLALDIPADTLRQRPDIQVAEARLVASMARLAQVEAARHPGLGLSGSLDWRSPRLTDLFDPAALTRALVFSASHALFDGGSARAQLRAQQAALEQARIALEQAVVYALQEVEAVLLALQASHQRLGHLEQATTAAINAETLARHRYASGLIDYRALLDAQRTRLNAESDQVTARAAWSAEHVRLYKALGGGWSRALLNQDLEISLHDSR